MMDGARPNADGFLGLTLLLIEKVKRSRKLNPLCFRVTDQALISYSTGLGLADTLDQSLHSLM